MNRRIITIAVLCSLVILIANSCLFWGNDDANQNNARLKSESLFPSRQIMIEVHPDSKTRVQNIEVPLDTLHDYLVRVSKIIGTEDVKVIVTAAEKTPFGDVSQAIDEARRAGYTDVSLSPRPLPK